jgi:predicted enzyme related to lactoylglutathione lyase
MACQPRVEITDKFRLVVHYEKENFKKGEQMLHIVIDCIDAAKLAEFWEKALSYDKLIALDHYVILASKTGSSEPQVILQQVPEPKITKNRIHIDIIANDGDIEKEANRLESIGAVRSENCNYKEYGICWIQMRDPEGNEFCVCQGF